ncbi:MAG: hypothetical protein WA765_04350 [Candidatus Acidiferrum sp.]
MKEKLSVPVPVQSTANRVFAGTIEIVLGVFVLAIGLVLMVIYRAAAFDESTAWAWACLIPIPIVGCALLLAGGMKFWRHK